MSDTAVDLAQLRQRLAKLGVHITEEDDVPNLNIARPANPRVVGRTQLYVLYTS